MAHFAKLDSDNIVTTVEVISNDILIDENGDEQESLGISFLRDFHNEPNAIWVQTSYNYNFRKNFAGIGFTYDSVNDAFISPKPFDSWTLNTTTFKWDPPVARPDDFESNSYYWNEDNQSWDLLT